MTYALNRGSELALGTALLEGLQAVELTLESLPFCLSAHLTLEHEADKLHVLIKLEQSRHTVTLQAGDPGNAQHLADQIEAIANGTADTAQTGLIGSRTAPHVEPFALSPRDESALRHLVRIGGTRHLECQVSVTVHNTLKSDRRDALVTTPFGTVHLQGGTPGCLYVVASMHIEAALNAA